MSARRYLKLLPESETLCRPAGACTRANHCQRHQQEPTGAQRLGNFHVAGVSCVMFVTVEYVDPVQVPARRMKHWQDGGGES
jgi:hypothetical protein